MYAGTGGGAELAAGRLFEAPIWIWRFSAKGADWGRTKKWKRAVSRKKMSQGWRGCLSFRFEIVGAGGRSTREGGDTAYTKRQSTGTTTLTLALTVVDSQRGSSCVAESGIFERRVSRKMRKGVNQRLQAPEDVFSKHLAHRHRRFADPAAGLAWGTPEASVTATEKY